MNPSPAVCILIENLTVPIDRRVWQEARTLRGAGYTVSIVCPTGAGFEKRYERMEEIDVYRYRLPWEGDGPLGYLLEYGWALAATLRLALKAYRKTRFRVLHACNPPDLFFLVGLVFKLFGVRYLFDHHDLCPELYIAKKGKKGVFYSLVRLAERGTFALAHTVISTNQSYREIALGRGGMPPERTFIVRSFPELARIRLQPPVAALKNGKDLLVVYLGVMGAQEGLDLLLESIEEIVTKRERRDVHFTLIGDGTHRPFLMRRVAEKNLDGAVRFTGRIPDDQLAAYLSTADVCVAPDSYNEMNDKSTMNKILEYMAYGRPVVLFDLTEGRRSAGDAALYARPDDSLDLAEKILTLLDSEDLRKELGRRARRRIETELNWEREKATLLKAYETLLKRD
ncbi:MAG: glycosyltransferase family 4 protein [Acidobacteria bacterium]|nr:glycosyltransferase family 4 protein [Acidobacteriota bacterium]